MADMHFDEGTTKLIDSEHGPVLVESGGFMIVAHASTQDHARAIKAAVRAAAAELGIEGVVVDYQPVVRVV